jgi:hypothetical protein
MEVVLAAGELAGKAVTERTESPAGRLEVRVGGVFSGEQKRRLEEVELLRGLADERRELLSG